MGGVLFRTDSFSARHFRGELDLFRCYECLLATYSMSIKRLALTFDTTPPTPVSRHYTGDPDVSLAEVSETEPNMANNAVFLKLPEFW